MEKRKSRKRKNRKGSYKKRSRSRRRRTAKANQARRARRRAPRGAAAKNPKPKRYTLMFRRSGAMEPVLRVVGGGLRAELLSSVRYEGGGRGAYFAHPKFIGSQDELHKIREQVVAVLAYDAGRRRKRFDASAAVSVRALPHYP